MASTVANLKAELDKLGVEYDAKAKKADLEQLLDEAKPADPTDETPEAPANDGEGPTDLDPPQPEQPDAEPYDGPVLLKGLIHNGRPLAAGSPVPQDLNEEQVERLERLGVICGGISPVQSGFSIFEGQDGDFYWHLRAENGEIIAQGEGYSSRSAAERGVEAVKAAVAASP